MNPVVKTYSSTPHEWHGHFQAVHMSSVASGRSPAALFLSLPLAAAFTTTQCLFQTHNIAVISQLTPGWTLLIQCDADARGVIFTLHTVEKEPASARYWSVIGVLDKREDGDRVCMERVVLLLTFSSWIWPYDCCPDFPSSCSVSCRPP